MTSGAWFFKGSMEMPADERRVAWMSAGRTLTPSARTAPEGGDRATGPPVDARWFGGLGGRTCKREEEKKRGPAHVGTGSQAPCRSAHQENAGDPWT